MLDRLAQLDTCRVSDALDLLELTGATIGIRPLWACHKIVGTVMTVLVGSKVENEPTQPMILPAIEAADARTVLLVANEGDQDISCWEEIVAHSAVLKGIRGVVLDGSCRDIAANEKLGFPVYGRGVAPLAARGRLVQKSFGKPVKFAGVSVSAGDLVIADRNGTVVIPVHRAEETIVIAERLREGEQAMIHALRSGRTVVDATHEVRFGSEGKSDA